ncbi:hypothetical protein DNU06_08955 [Putridiphycobacter roseus]|uniref:DUF1697 domain-containing protein n=1 Tax=Putridiphycobacter roseus TaxID=2219161 RepID=A0A2W1N1F8_9FLAO|nr:DUF1697 domain-containing protein [Putridiphycobacter roseus]PZE17390.1 hypothetical protein DNU06_08955 [Putridiphycobacter roseus]
MKKYVGLLRGVNVGGKHKVPMEDLKIVLQNLNCENVYTILNSGNVVFESNVNDIRLLTKTIENRISSVFGFPIPLILAEAKTIVSLMENNPFKEIEETTETRFFVSFLKKSNKSPIEIPWSSEDQSFKILRYESKIICSVLDLSKANTPKAMGIVEASFGKEITTRNWNTISRIVKKC